VDGGDGDGVAEADIGAYEATAPLQFYVSPAGSDSNAGVTPGLPLRHIATAISRAAVSGVITVAPGTYVESLALDKSLTIQGRNGAAASTIIKASGAGIGTAVVIYPATTVTLADVTISNGNALSTNYGYGGGVFNEGALTMQRCIVTNNHADYSGGGVVNYVDATMVLEDTSIANNTADQAAGVENDGTMTINRCAVYSNVAVGAAGGIGNTDSLSIVNSTIGFNQAAQGGGLYNSMGRTALTNVTISANSATDGGGIANLSSIAFPDGGVVSDNSVVAGNGAGNGPDISGEFVSNMGYNFIGNDQGANVGNEHGDHIGTATQPLDARLGPLADNGGYTPTMNPAANSPLIDAGPGPSDTPYTYPSTDQRGIARPIGAKSDIGAVEYQPRFIVTRTADDVNSGSLRWAINQANTTNNAVIAFAIAPTGTAGGVKTIKIASALGALPVIARQAFVDGWSQGGSSYTGMPLIELDGELVPGAFGLNLQAPGCVVRGLAINRFPNQGGNAFGIGIFGSGTDAWVYGCMLGTDASGTLARGNGQGGIWAAAGGALIGSNLDGVNDAAETNVISDNVFDGILVTSSNNTIAGNVIGMNLAASASLPNGTIVPFGGIRIESGAGNRISQNAIAYNHDLGIDLGGDGVTPNDAGDDDGGANALQNYPLITGIATDAGQTTFAGTLNSTPGGDFTVEVFGSDAAGATGYGQGQRYLAHTTVHTDASGDGAWSVSLPAVASGQWISATATDAGGNTSEFSLAVPVSQLFTTADVTRALRLASGLAAYTSADNRLDVETGGASAGRVDMMDCARLVRKAAGKDANP
jgi:hypothetical protein